MNPTEPTLDESLGELMKQVPAPIQEFLTSPERNKFLAAITSKYGLHVDQAGVFENQFLAMLLGVIEPDAFAAALSTAGIDDAAIEKIAQDVNTEVFMPLRQKMRGQGSAEAPPVKPSAPHAAAPAAQAAQQPVVPKPPVQTVPVKPSPAGPAAPKMMPPPANLPGVMQPKAPTPAAAKPVFATSFAANAAPMQATTPPAAPKASAASPVSPLAGALKAAGVPLLEDHEEPHIDLKKAAPPPAPAPRVMPTTMPPVQPMSAVPAAPAMPKPIAPSAPAMPAAPMPTHPPVAQTPPSKSYAVDPYREQPEEFEK